MPKKMKPKAARSDREEYKRFLEAARKVQASDDPKDFDRAFGRLMTTSRESASSGARRPRRRP